MAKENGNPPHWFKNEVIKLQSVITETVCQQEKKLIQKVEDILNISDSRVHGTQTSFEDEDICINFHQQKESEKIDKIVKISENSEKNYIF